MLINNEIVLVEREKIANCNVEFRLLFTENEFAYLTNISHLLQVIFLASAKKNTYLLHPQTICDSYICKWNLPLWHRISVYSKFVVSVLKYLEIYPT